MRATSHCPALPPPTGSIVTVSTESALRQQAYEATPGTTILVEAGTYHMQDLVHIVNDAITLRGATGSRGDVVLDFGGMVGGHFGVMVDGDDVTIADLTIRNANDHGVSIQGADRPVLYNLHIYDIGDQLVKVNPIGDGSEDGLLACSRLEYTTSAPDEYTNGISAHLAHRWVVRDNEWYRIRTPGNDPVPTILFWSASTDTVVERNLLVDCYQGIAFGNASHGEGDHVGGVVRNNMIYASMRHDVVIEMVHASGWLVANNTALLLDPDGGLTWGMEARYPDSQGTFAYNLTNMAIWEDRDGGQGVLVGNVTGAGADWFVDAAAGDLHLVSTATGAIDQAASMPEVADDYDGQGRPFGPAPDVGADEYVHWNRQVYIPIVLRESEACRSPGPYCQPAHTTLPRGAFISWGSPSSLSERTVILRSEGGKAAEATKNLDIGARFTAENEILRPLRGLRMTKRAL
ncbi:MAG: right-handed parallel beta-helix repeat-containing protein, partial [Anaerolineae bacterium]|nr:right-handed parallel beta-helix repeat-containing protein [Anaerolineae bacterium]